MIRRQRERILLASTSPRRAELLTQLRIDFEAVDPAVDETVRADEDPLRYAVRIAHEKAMAVDARMGEGRVVLAADTVVVGGGRILGKPASREEALEILALLSGREHRVISAVTACRSGAARSRTSETLVRFRQLTKEELQRYWDTGEPRDKAGAYGIQGLGSVFVTSISGSYSGVVGLPLAETAELLHEFGIDCL